MQNDKKTKLSPRKQAEQAPKYGLYIDSVGWLADKQNLTGVMLTPDKELARQFSVGFDDPIVKLSIWNIQAKKVFGTDIEFEAVYF